MNIASLKQEMDRMNINYDNDIKHAQKQGKGCSTKGEDNCLHVQKLMEIQPIQLKKICI